MIVLPQMVELKWTWHNVRHYPQKGYEFTKKNDNFSIYVLDLLESSSCKIDVICDYCLTPYKIKYSHYIMININGNIHKDACKKCGKLKHKESNLLIYGMESTNSLESVKQKKREIFALSEEFVREEFKKREYIMVGKYINSATPVEYICKSHISKGLLKITYGHLSNGKGCKYCAVERRLGENNHNWQGGITSVNSFLRDRISCWTFDSLKNNDFKCIITGSKKNLAVHHIMSFRDIAKESFKITKLPILKLSSLYEREDLERLSEVCLELHYKYGLGVTLTKTIHNEFHRIYGKKNNTKEQFEEFYKNKICEAK